MNQRFILAVDQSTAGTKVNLVNQNGEILFRNSLEHNQHYPFPGWVEQDPMEIYENVKSLIGKTVQDSSIHLHQIAGISITNQRETVVIWDKQTGLPVYNAIVWQCRRTADDCRQLKDEALEKVVNAKTGLTIDPYFSAIKIKWILENNQETRQKAEKGQVLFGTMDSWVIWKLTNGKVHATDYTNASRTMLFNIFELKWDQELLDLFGIPPEILPEVKFSDEIFGYSSDLGRLELPISGVIGDSHGALVGQLCLEEGNVKATFGTGSSLLMNTGATPIQSNNGLMTTIAYAYKGEVTYALEGIINSTGDTIKWLKDNLGLFESFQEAESMATEVQDNEGVYVIPSFSGLGAPYWNPFTKAAIIGMTRRTNKNHLVRAGMESIVYQVKDITKLMHEETGIPLSDLRVDGGPTTNAFLMQFLADILKINVMKASIPELSSMGAAYLAGIATKFWHSFDEIKGLHHSNLILTAKMDEKLSSSYYQGWKSTVSLINQQY